jgi:hypothetical protein
VTSTTLTGKDIERILMQKGKTAPRVTEERIEEVIQKAAYHQFPGTTVTVCCLTLVNGYNVVGQSACASPENFDAQLGRDLALKDAKRQIWALEGYALRERLTHN